MAAVMTGLTEKSIVDWYNFCRDVCARWTRRNPRIVGGPGHVVQIDETCVRKAKYNRGRRIPPRWVFGGLDTTTRKGFLVKVPNRSAKTLLTIVMQRIRPGTEIHSDEWRSYRRLADLPVNPPYVHLTVNHSRMFKKTKRRPD